MFILRNLYGATPERQICESITVIKVFVVKTVGVCKLKYFNMCRLYKLIGDLAGNNTQTPNFSLKYPGI